MAHDRENRGSENEDGGPARSLTDEILALGTAAARFGWQAVERSVHHTSKIVRESKKAFYEELDPNIEDAEILEEYERMPNDSSSQ